jgi:hypothetical protein
MKNLFLFLFFPLISFSQNTQEKEEYEIYKSCLINYTQDTSSIFLICGTSEYYNWEFSYDNINNKNRFSPFNLPPPVDTNFIDALKNYQQIGKERITLNFLTKYETNNKIKIVTEKERHNLISRGSYSWFRLPFKHRSFYDVYGFSKIVYSKNHNFAVVYMSSQSDGRAGIGSLILCLKEKNIWTVKHVFKLWIS